MLSDKVELVTHRFPLSLRFNPKPEHANPEDLKRFPKLELFTVKDKFGGWAQAQKEHFDDGGTFDQIYTP